MKVFCLLTLELEGRQTPSENAGEAAGEHLTPEDMSALAERLTTAASVIQAVPTKDAALLVRTPALVIRAGSLQPSGLQRWSTPAAMLLGGLLTDLPELDGMILLPIPVDGVDSGKLGMTAVTRTSDAESLKRPIGFRMKVIEALCEASSAIVESTFGLVKPFLAVLDGIPLNQKQPPDAT